MNQEYTSCCSCNTDLTPPPCNCNEQVKPLTEIRMTTSTITIANKVDHFFARWGVNRMGHRVVPGLYQLGTPNPTSPIIVTANYTLSFDAVRSALAGMNCYILVLDTNGINVWCAAGKGTFGTDELVRRIELTKLTSFVEHRSLILPQLGAPGISAHEVQRKSGFKVEYAPIRARDLPQYLSTRTTTPDMRRVQFSLMDRLAVTPIEVVHIALPLLVVALILYFLVGALGAIAAISAVLAGTVLFPALLPFIPTQDFSTKGVILGAIVAVPIAVSFGSEHTLPLWANILATLTALLIMPAVTAYLALNFTGSTTFTSRTGVKKEIFRYVPFMAMMAGSGLTLAILLGLLRFTGGI